VVLNFPHYQRFPGEKQVARNAAPSSLVNYKTEEHMIRASIKKKEDFKSSFRKIKRYVSVMYLLRLKVSVPTSLVIWRRLISIRRILIKITGVNNTSNIWCNWRAQCMVAQALPIKTIKPPEIISWLVTCAFDKNCYKKSQESNLLVFLNFTNASFLVTQTFSRSIPESNNITLLIISLSTVFRMTANLLVSTR
jgi:hypothetical protein